MKRKVITVNMLNENDIWHYVYLKLEDGTIYSDKIPEESINDLNEIQKIVDGMCEKYNLEYNFEIK